MEIGNLERSLEWDKMSEELAWSYSFHFARNVIAAMFHNVLGFRSHQVNSIEVHPHNFYQTLSHHWQLYNESSKFIRDLQNPEKDVGAVCHCQLKYCFYGVYGVCPSIAGFLFLCTESLNRKRKTALFQFTKKPTTSANANWWPVENYLPTNQ